MKGVLTLDQSICRDGDVVDSILIDGQDAIVSLGLNNDGGIRASELSFHFSVDELEQAKEWMSILAQEDGRRSYSGALEIKGKIDFPVKGHVYDALAVAEHMVDYLSRVGSITGYHEDLETIPMRVLAGYNQLIQWLDRMDVSYGGLLWHDNPTRDLSLVDDRRAAHLVAISAEIVGSMSDKKLKTAFPKYALNFHRHMRRWDYWAKENGFEMRRTMSEIANPPLKSDSDPAQRIQGRETESTTDDMETYENRAGSKTLFLR